VVVHKIHIGVEDGRVGRNLPPPPKKLGKIFLGQISCKNSGILLIFICLHIFSGKMSCHQTIHDYMCYFFLKSGGDTTDPATGRHPLNWNARTGRIRENERGNEE